MKIVIAMDSFKGSMTSMEAGNAAKEGVLSAIPEAQVIVRPLADGGEGTMEALAEGLGGETILVKVNDPLGRKVEAKYAIYSAKTGEKTAIIEMAQAAGLTLLTEQERNPYKATTYGVGEMICDAIDRGCRNFLIGIGGSATNDGGMGMLRALGYRFFDKKGLELLVNSQEMVVAGSARALGCVKRICALGARKELAECTFRVACDVTNPLCGENGATCIYGPQKGLAMRECAEMDAAMASFADAVTQFAGKDYRDVPGAGAAGGMGFAFVSMLGGKLVPGAQLVMQATKMEDDLKKAGLFLTGEGRMDGQTVQGKAPMMAAALAKQMNPECRTMVFAGQIISGAEKVMAYGIDEMYAITPEGMDEKQAMEKFIARKNMSCAVQKVMAKKY